MCFLLYVSIKRFTCLVNLMIPVLVIYVDLRMLHNF